MGSNSIVFMFPKYIATGHSFENETAAFSTEQNSVTWLLFVFPPSSDVSCSSSDSFSMAPPPATLVNIDFRKSVCDCRHVFGVVMAGQNIGSAGLCFTIGTNFMLVGSKFLYKKGKLKSIGVNLVEAV